MVLSISFYIAKIRFHWFNCEWNGRYFSLWRKKNNSSIRVFRLQQSLKLRWIGVPPQNRSTTKRITEPVNELIPNGHISY